MSGSGRKIVFIGAGQMAEALVRGLLAAGLARPEDLLVTDVSPDRLAHFRARYGIDGGNDNAAAARLADALVLAVKPQVLPEVCRGLVGALTHDPLTISIAAGVPAARIEDWLGGSARVVRAMPNMPALIGAGMTAIAPGRRATAKDLERAEQLLGAAGAVVRVREEELDAVTAVSGSGPAYVFYLAEAMRAAAEGLGLGPSLADTLVRRTILGAGRLLEAEREANPEELRRRVTSKGGTTEAAVGVLETRGVRAAIVEAVRAAAARARELSARAV
jgi:pyrroline-5-carboxylate reductase